MRFDLTLFSVYFGSEVLALIDCRR